MGRFVVTFFLLIAIGMVAVNGISFSWLEPRGVGTRIEGREVVLNADQLEARFSMVGTLDESYMLFGGDTQQRPNSITHATLAGLATHQARFIAERYPDFHRCSSPGAKQAQAFTQPMSFVAADRAALDTLSEALALFEERLREDGDRTCIHVKGAPLSLDSVRVDTEGVSEDISHEVLPKFAGVNFVLAETVEIEDCRTLLR